MLNSVIDSEKKNYNTFKELFKSKLVQFSSYWFLLTLGEKVSQKMNNLHMPVWISVLHNSCSLRVLQKIGNSYILVILSDVNLRSIKTTVLTGFCPNLLWW